MGSNNKGSVNPFPWTHRVHKGNAGSPYRGSPIRPVDYTKMEDKINVQKHVFVPKHIKLSDEEKKEFLESRNLSKAQLPQIEKEDPALAHLDAKKGDLIRITRKSPTTGEAMIYRVVI